MDDEIADADGTALGGAGRPATGPAELARRDTELEAENVAAGTRTEHPTAPGPLSLPGPGTVLDQYELIRPLGRGGMGVVFLARDIRLGRRVAVKFLARDNGRLAERFQAEARATARCKHENIVVIHDVGKAHGYAYMVLEYLEGITLRTWLEENWAPTMCPGGVSAVRAVEVMVPVVRALDHAHDLGLVHRDLKPENIILTHRGAVKVVDFGIAMVLDSNPALPSISDDADAAAAMGERETAVGEILGTLPYMSPEQLSADEIDQRSDLWAVGIRPGRASPHSCGPA